MILKVFLILLILFAIMVIQANKLRRSIIYLGIFSLITSFCYLLHHAPDVAIAEAVIGSTLSVILYLVALQKYKVFTIYYTNEASSLRGNKYISKGYVSPLALIEQFCISKELEPQIIYTTESLENIQSSYSYDLIVRQKNKKTWLLYGNYDNYQLNELQKILNHKRSIQTIHIIYMNEEGEL